MTNKNLWIKYILIVSLINLSCSKDENMSEGEPTPNLSCPGTIEGAVASGNNDVLVWSDEFDTDGSPCTKNWTYDVGATGWGNNEVQYYSRNNAIIEDGVLKITAKKETYLGAAYTTARIKTQNRYSFTYGKVEVRAILPEGGGTWPAIWMLGDNINTVGWPACGEIDIMEHRGNHLGETSSAIHNTSGHGDTPYVGYPTKDATVVSEYHIYAINWTKDKIEFLKDNVVHYTYNPSNKNATNWPYDKNHFIILNVAMGGSLGGSIDPDFTESDMQIDYVRVYQ